ncbi:hypothetical protein [Actibacterium lipolyticum]|uniref:Uncharacterized protein n=1 Tax=Actibacterium lipolyticum TaxID=1524263 RepID=A0A238JIZ6_9RHOB|nr:hypothetical protein [Actibacterium lipolyticum]SMX30650.1 hypothetical protein COL8621_00011 [Actibacterium lipolyticum]
MTVITKLWQDEALRMDPERLAAIYVDMGEARAQVAVSRAMEDLAITLERIKGLARVGRLADLAEKALRVRDIAEPLGLSSLSKAAANLAEVGGTKNPVALAATLARLERVANRSLKMVWDLQDLSG